MKNFLIPAVVAVLLALLVANEAPAQSKEEASRLYSEGVRLQKNPKSIKDLQKAMEMYQQALTIVENAKLDRGICDVCNNMGIIYQAWGKHDKALESYEKALKSCTRINDRKGVAYALGNLGNLYQDIGQYDQAAEYYQKVLAIAMAIPDREREGMTLNNLGNVYRKWGKYDEALEFYNRSLTIGKELQTQRWIQSPLRGLGNVHLLRGQYDMAAKFYREALEIAKRIRDREGEEKSLGGLGSVYRHWAEYDKAIQSYEEALKIGKEIGDRVGEEASIGNLGLTYKAQGKYDKALPFFERALALSRELKDRQGEGNALGNLGNLYAMLGQHANALDTYEKAAAICHELRDPNCTGINLHNLGTVYESWGQYDKAVAYYEKALTLARQLGDREGEGHILIVMGRLYAQQGKYPQALTNLQKGLEIWKAAGVPIHGPSNLIANIYLDNKDPVQAEAWLKDVGYDSTRGRFHLMKLEYSKAEEYYAKVLQRAKDTRRLDDFFTAYTGLGTVYELQEDYARAAEYYNKAVGLTNDLRLSIPPVQRERFFTLKVEGFGRTAPYEGLARVLVKLGKPADALTQSEFTKARVFAEAISRRRVAGGYKGLQDVLKADSELTDELASRMRDLQAAYARGNVLRISALEPRVTDLKQKLAAHIEMLWRHHPTVAATRYPQPMRLDQTGLADDEWVLSYHVTDAGLIVYLTKGKIVKKTVLKQVTRQVLTDLVDRFRKPLEMEAKDDEETILFKLKSFDFTTGKKLSDLVLGDVLCAIPQGASLIIVPDDCLGVLPFEMLPLNESGRIKDDKELPYASDAVFFADRNPISYYESITSLTLTRLHGKQRNSKGKLLVFADPVLGMADARAQPTNGAIQLAGAETDLYRHLLTTLQEPAVSPMGASTLHWTAQLAKDLEEIFPGKVECYTGLKASKDVLLNRVGPRLNDFETIVFATHGYFGRNLPGINEPVLMLTLVPPGIDGWLRMSEVGDLELNADLVALTACQTGLGHHVVGEGTLGMGRAFMQAGARAVLMSLWAVDAKASALLVKSLFKHIKEGKNKLEALKLARQEVRKEGFDHPFFWAGFVLVGEVK